jgi:hypothetical protein
VDRSGRSGDSGAAVYLAELTIDGAHFPSREAYPFNLHVVQETTSDSYRLHWEFFRSLERTSSSTS